MKRFISFSLAASAVIFVNAQNTVIDFDGNVYPTVAIGSQIWTAQNLYSTHYADGSLIPDNCWYNNNLSTDHQYGKLYNWNAAMNNSTEESVQGVCPNGFHLPSDEEWYELFDYISDSSSCAFALKGTDTAYWNQPLISTNTSGFNAVAAGNAWGCSTFDLQKTHAEFWTSTEIDNDRAKNWSLNNQSAFMFRHYNQDKPNGFSIRCVSNERASIDKAEIIQSIKVSPNPLSTQAILQTDFIFHNATLSMYNAYGHKVREINNISGQNITLFRDDLAIGIYYIHLSQENKIIAADKIIVTD